MLDFLDHFWPPTLNNDQFLPSNVQLFGDILDPQPHLKSDIIYARSQMALVEERKIYY